MMSDWHMPEICWFQQICLFWKSHRNPVLKMLLISIGSSKTNMALLHARQGKKVCYHTLSRMESSIVPQKNAGYFYQISDVFHALYVTVFNITDIFLIRQLYLLLPKEDLRLYVRNVHKQLLLCRLVFLSQAF